MPIAPHALDEDELAELNQAGVFKALRVPAEMLKPTPEATQRHQTKVTLDVFELRLRGIRGGRP